MRTLLRRWAKSIRNVDFDPLGSKTLNRFSGNLACKITSTVCKMAVTDGCGVERWAKLKPRVLFHFLVALNSIDFPSRKRRGKGHGVNSLKKLRNSRNIVNVETKFKTTESTSLACQKVCMCELNPEEDEAQISRGAYF